MAFLKWEAMSYHSDFENSWATIDDLYDRYGEEFVDKLSIRRNWNAELEDYVADESKSNMTRVQILALEDAKELLKSRMSLHFQKIEWLDTYLFYAVKQFHIRLTIETLKNGGDCSCCQCLEDLSTLLGGDICNDTICLPKKKSFISASKAHFKCDHHGGCGC